MVRHTGEDFIDEESINIASVFLLQSTRVDSTTFNVPEPYRSAAHSDASFSGYILNVTVIEVESIVEPDRVTDDVRREPVALICVHDLILPISVS